MSNPEKESPAINFFSHKVTYLVTGIRDWCREKKIPMKEFAERIGVSPQYLNDIARQRRAVSEALQLKIIREVQRHKPK